FLLRNRAPRRFTADAWQKTDACTRRQLEKLKQQWQAEWAAEQNADSEQIIERINRKLDLMRERMREGMSEEELRLEAELKEARKRRMALPPPDGWREDDAADGEV
ncbi:MAG: hypothetical protein LBV50_08190, partial [Novosphingobium sp.]|nr:hypothetical protein [Novosphingobium sp.]